MYTLSVIYDKLKFGINQIIIQYWQMNNDNDKVIINI